MLLLTQSTESVPSRVKMDSHKMNLPDSFSSLCVQHQCLVGFAKRRWNEWRILFRVPLNFSRTLILSDGVRYFFRQYSILFLKLQVLEGF